MTEYQEHSEQAIRSEIVCSFLNKYAVSFGSISKGQAAGLFSDVAKDHRHLFPEAETIIAGLVDHSILSEDVSLEFRCQRYSKLFEHLLTIYSPSALQPWHDVLSQLGIVTNEVQPLAETEIDRVRQARWLRSPIVIIIILVILLLPLSYLLRGRPDPNRNIKNANSNPSLSSIDKMLPSEQSLASDAETPLSIEPTIPRLLNEVDLGPSQNQEMLANDSFQARKFSVGARLGNQSFQAERQSIPEININRDSNLKIDELAESLRSGSLKKSQLILPSAIRIANHWVQRITINNGAVVLVLRSSSDEISKAKCEALVRSYQEDLSNRYKAYVRVELESSTMSGYLLQCASS